MSTVLVTGGSGRIGSLVVRYLADDGHAVYNLDAQPADRSLPAKSIRCDLTQPGAVYDAFATVRPEYVCHIAANPSSTGFPRYEIFHNNIMSAFLVMQAAGEFGVRRLVYGSSIMATGFLTSDELPGRFPVTEREVVDSPNVYGMSKRFGEKIADSFVLEYRDLSIASVRINNVVPQERYPSILEKREMVRTTGSLEDGANNFWSYIDLRDTAAAVIAAMHETSRGHEAYLIAAKETWLPITTQEAFLRHYGFDPQLPEGDPYQTVYDCGKMKHDFGWEPRYSIRDYL
jgi:nucleoside-diphosphate-sugar epimerase